MLYYNSKCPILLEITSHASNRQLCRVGFISKGDNQTVYLSLETQNNVNYIMSYIVNLMKRASYNLAILPLKIFKNFSVVIARSKLRSKFGLFTIQKTKHSYYYYPSYTLWSTYVVWAFHAIWGVMPQGVRRLRRNGGQGKHANP
jgi:hypothetical protein